MSEEIKKKIPLRDKRKHLSDKYIKPLPFEETTYSVGDDTVIGLRIFVNKGGTKTFYYVNSAKDIKERIEYFPTINVTKARDEAKLIAAEVLKGHSASQIKRDRRTELTAAEAFKQYMDERVHPPQYAEGTIKKWISAYRSWFDVTTTDKVIKALWAKNKNAAIADKKLSELNMDNLKRFHRLIGSKSPISANTIIEMFRTVMEYAKDKGFVAINPVRFKVKELYEKKEDNRMLTKPQMDAAIAYLINYDKRSQHPKLNLNYYKENNRNPVACTVLGGALLQGRRYRSEWAKITYKQLSLTSKKLSLNQSKVGQKEYNLGRKVLKLSQALFGERYREGSPFNYQNDIRKDYVFPSKMFGRVNNAGKINDKPYINNVRKTWMTMLKDLGFDHLPPYNVRHSFATNALSKTKNIATVGEMLGHSKKNGYKSTLRYARVLNEDVIEALDLIDGPEEKEETKVVNLTK
jgi:integrase